MGRDGDRAPLRLRIRADATARTGAGHVMRCVALGESWLALGYGPVVIAGDVSIPFVTQRIAALGIDAVGSELVAADELLLVDTYAAAERLGAGRVEARLRVLVDDLGEAVPEGYDAVWNPNAYGQQFAYDGFRGERLLGERFVPIRGGLPRWSAPGEGTLFTLGAGSPGSRLRDGLAALATRASGDPVAVTGAWSPAGWARVTPNTIWDAAARSARVAAAAGSTTWELAAVGAPAVLIVTADNQVLVGEWARRAGVPVVDAREASAEALADALEAALPAARPLPAIANGTARVAKRLRALAGGAAHE